MTNTVGFLLYEVPKQSNPQRQKAERWFPGAGERGWMENSCFMGTVSIWNGEKVLEMGGDQLYNTVNVLNVTEQCA